MSARRSPSQIQSKPSLETKKRKRAANACLRCRMKKQRCDGISQPCANCVKASSECTFPDEVMSEKFLRQHIAVLEARVKELSSALKEIKPGHSALKGKEDEILSEQDLVNGFGFLSLTSGAEPLYVGGSSGASWARIFSTALCNQTGEAHYFTGSLIPPKASPRPLSSKFNVVKFSSSSEPPCFLDNCAQRDKPYISIQMSNGFVFPPLPEDGLSEEIFATVYTTVQTRHCFTNFVVLKEWFNDRDKYCTSEQPPGADEPRTAAFFLWLTYALGLRLWEMRGKIIPGLPSHQHYFQAALQYYDHVSSNTTTIQALLFLAMYSFRSESGLSAWHLVGLAMRTALELGLHRKTPKSQQLGPFNEEMKKRIWWSVYCLERTIAFQLGRPICIQDDEIDNELPLEIDCHVTDDKQIRARRAAIDMKLSETGTNLEENPYPLGWTTMSPSLHHIRLTKILTKIKQHVYHIRFSSGNSSNRWAHVDSLSLELDQWRANIPSKNLTNTSTGSFLDLKFLGGNEMKNEKENGWDLAAIPFYTGEWLELQYHNAVQNLFIPCALTASCGSAYIRRATHAAMTASELQRKRLRENPMVPLSVYSLHKLFMSGVFMLFALDKDPNLFTNAEVKCMKQVSGHEKYDVSTEKNSTPLDKMLDTVPGPIKSCQECLSIYANHYPQAKPYAKCFESMTKVWIKGFETKDNRPGISQMSYSSPVKGHETVLDPQQDIFTDRQFKSSNPPTLYKDDLNLPGRLRPHVGWSDSLTYDSDLKYPSGTPRYDLLSLGTVNTYGDLFQLLKLEGERYDAQRPWLLGRMNRESSNNCFEALGSNSCFEAPPNIPNLNTFPATDSENLSGKRSQGSFSSASSLNNPLISHFMGNSPSIANYSSLNGSVNEPDLCQSPINRSQEPKAQLINSEARRNYGIEIESGLDFRLVSGEEVVSADREQKIQESTFGPHDFFRKESSSAYGEHPASLVKMNHQEIDQASKDIHPHPVLDGSGGCLESDVYNDSRIKSSSSTDWLGKALEVWRNTSALGGTLPDMCIGGVGTVWPQEHVGCSESPGPGVNRNWLPNECNFSTITPGSANLQPQAQ